MTKTDDQILQDVTITKSAAEWLIKIQTENEGQYLRASVKGGCCSGMSYQLEWDVEKGEFDKVYHYHGIDLVVDMRSLLYLQGKEIDFSTDLLSGGFIFNNPNANRTCGWAPHFQSRWKPFIWTISSITVSSENKTFVKLLMRLIGPSTMGRKY